MNNSSICEHDPLILFVHSKEETIEMFGEDYLEEYGYEIPEDVLKRYEQVTKDFSAMQRELRKYKDERFSKRDT